jgi:hypothetical protein
MPPPARLVVDVVVSLEVVVRRVPLGRARAWAARVPVRPRFRAPAPRRATEAAVVAGGVVAGAATTGLSTVRGVAPARGRASLALVATSTLLK